MDSKASYLCPCHRLVMTADPWAHAPASAAPAADVRVSVAAAVELEPVRQQVAMASQVVVRQRVRPVLAGALVLLHVQPARRALGVLFVVAYAAAVRRAARRVAPAPGVLFVAAYAAPAPRDVPRVAPALVVVFAQHAVAEPRPAWVRSP